MSTIRINLPGLDANEAYNLVRDALYEWAETRAGRAREHWSEGADELARKYVATRYPRAQAMPDADGSTLTPGYSTRFQRDKAASTARKIRAVCGFGIVEIPPTQENTVAEHTKPDPEASPLTESGTSFWMSPMEPHQSADPIPEYAAERANYYRLNAGFDAASDPNNALAALIRPVYADVAPEVRELAGAHFDIPRHLIGWIFMVKAPGDGAVVVTGQTAAPRRASSSRASAARPRWATGTMSTATWRSRCCPGRSARPGCTSCSPATERMRACS